ncbi:hypothetical protein PAHAL_9G290000 [Panicum hallii]|uniref:Uncharacterized protein n=1 Tax=Panicum hallii TaxID=206008 RepID=A0A2T8I2V8_9POAL|nr:hypothetical protein PAHAL_9G290000 [Panicum hallii]
MAEPAGYLHMSRLPPAKPTNGPPAPPPIVDSSLGSSDLGPPAPSQPRPPRFAPASPRHPTPTREPRSR